jgi:hypothetical protein
LPTNTYITHDASPPLSYFQHLEKELTFSIVLLFTNSPLLCLQHVTNVLAKQLSIVKVSSKIAAAVNKSLQTAEDSFFCANNSPLSMSK